MIINEIDFLNCEHSAFRELESLFTEKLFELIDNIKAGKLNVDVLLKFNEDITTAIDAAEEKIISPLLDQASREAAEIFKQHKTTINSLLVVEGENLI